MASSQNIDKLDDSFESAYQSLQRKKSNLAFAFFCLDKQRAVDMGVLYAYCRILDDISDDENASIEDKKAALEKWRDELNLIYSNSACSRFGEELKQVVQRRKIPHKYMADIIDGVYRDTNLEEFKTSKELKDYCYGVASAVGLCSIYVFGFENQRTKDFAQSLGYALQYTNILRDIVDDYHTQKRVYIPSEELEFFGLKREDLAEPSNNPKAKELFRFLAFRAKHYFNQSRRLLPKEDRKNMLPALIMSEIYEAILNKIISSNFDINKKIIKLSKIQKIFYAFRAIAKSKLPFKNKKFGSVDIFGGGISGMMSAYKLCKDGFDVRLFESRNYTAGRACSFKCKAIDNAVLDNGNHAIMTCYKNFIGFLKELGTSDVLFESESPITFFCDDKSKIVLDLNLLTKNPLKFITTFGGLSAISGFQAKENAWLLIKIKLGLSKALDNQTAEDFLNLHNINDTSKEVFWKPFCESAINTSLAECDSKIFITTLKKSLLAVGGKSKLIFFKKPIDTAFEKIAFYLNACQSEFRLGENITALNFDGDTLISFSTSKEENLETKYAISALNDEALNSLLAKGNPLKESLSKLEHSNILNFHFTTDKKLFKGDCACLVKSPIHWVFDRSCIYENYSTYLYAATISDCKNFGDLDSKKKLLENEIKAYFGDADIIDFVPVMCKSATIKATIKSEMFRPNFKNNFTNFFIVGDYAKCDLPCTMESAAYNVSKIDL